jgi:hypothetical protein
LLKATGNVFTFGRTLGVALGSLAAKALLIAARRNSVANFITIMERESQSTVNATASRGMPVSPARFRA